MLWILTRTLVAPFSTSPEHIGLLDATVLILEIISIIGLMAWHHAIKQSVANVITTALVIILLSGSLFYGGARSLELVFPDSESAHGHEDKQTEEIMDEMMDNNLQQNNKLDGASSSGSKIEAINNKKTEDDHDNDDGHHN